ncbi:MAG: two-component regulator propeller domain-containing protein [Verrucomicrobiales bacterium]
MIEYRLDESPDAELSNFKASAIYEDTSHRLWIAGAESGLLMFDPRIEQFQQFFHENSAPTGEVHAIAAGEDCLWLATESGLIALDLDTLEFDNLVPEIPISAVYEEPGQGLWLGTGHGTLLRFNTATRMIGEELVLNSIGTKAKRDMKIVPGTGDDLWIGVSGTQGGGLYRFDRATGKLTSYIHDENDSGSLSDNSITALKFDDAGFLWIGTRDGGLNRLAPSEDRFIRFAPEPENSTSLPHVHVTGIAEDQSGWLWIATRGGGVCRFDPRQSWCVLYEYAAAHKDVGFFGRISAIAQAPESNVWIACAKGIIEWHRTEDRFIRYLETRDENDTLSGTSFRTILADGRRHRLWIGGKNGVVVYDLEAEKARRLDSIPDNVRATVEVNGHLWIGTASGLRSLEMATEKVTAFQANEMLSKPIEALCADGDGLWIGTQNDGLLYLDFASGQTEEFTMNPGAGSLPSNSIRSVFVDSRGWVWAGTLRGLCRRDGDSRKWIVYDNGGGFASREIRTIGDDREGNLWLGTVSGIVRLAAVDSDSPIYHFYPELNGARIGSVQGYCEVNGNLQLFGGYHGVYRIDPSLWRDTGPPKVVFSNVKFGNFIVPILNHKNSPLKAHINVARRIALPPDQKSITVDFAALDFDSIDLHRYSAKLLPFDTRFSDLENTSHVTYTNLPPGDYTLYVRAANSRGIWSEDPETLQITVLRAWWQTRAFRSLIFALTAGCIVLVFRFRTQRIRKRNQQLAGEIVQRKRVQEILSGREQFIRIVTDHIPILIAYVDPQLRIQFSNNRFRQLFRRSEEEITDITLRDIYGQLYEQKIASRAKSALRGEDGTYRCEFPVGEGEIRIYECTYVAHRSTAGDVIGFFLLAEDITDKVRTEKELQRRRDELAHFSRVALIGEMTGALAHEINQPLAGVSFQAQAARRLLAKPGELDRDLLGETIEDILSDNDRAGQIVRRLWHLYKRREAVHTAVDINELVQDTVELSRSHRELNNLTLKVELPEEPVHVSGDFIQLQQVLLNLLRNGEDSILEKRQQQEPQAGQQLFRIAVHFDPATVDIMVTDRGLGISPQRMALMFTPFESSKSTGLGLGLAISKNIIDSHGGSIRVESEEGFGATFFIHLPRLYPVQQ